MSNTTTAQPKPKSVRLNKQHREDILNSVMQQWDVKNPTPLNEELQELFIATCKKMLEASSKAEKRMQLFRQTSNIHNELVAAFSKLSPKAKSACKTDSQITVPIRFLDKDGNEKATIEGYIPVEFATELGIHFGDTYEAKTDAALRMWPQYVETRKANTPNTDDVKFVRVIKLYKTVPDYYNVMFFAPDSIKQYRNHLKAQRKLNLHQQEQLRMRAEVSDYLDQFNTTGQIRESWPDLVQYLPAHIADPAQVIKLPALTVSRLNERLGIK